MSTGLSVAALRHLVRAEAHRLLARRFTQVMVVALIAAFGVTLFTTAATTHQPSAPELRRAELRADAQRADLERIRARCERATGPDAPREARFEFPRDIDCAQYDPTDVRTADFLDGVFSFTNSIAALVIVLSAFLSLFGYLVGASFVGAELTSGGMTNLLLWQPRRLHVLGAKLGVLLAGLAALGAVASVVYVGAFWLLARTSGYPDGQSAAFWGDLALLGLRGVVLALVCAAAGFAVATLGRHTAAAVGLAAGYAVVWETGARVVMAIIQTEDPARAMLSSYLAAWMVGRLTDPGADNGYTITWWHAGLVFTVLLAALLGAAFAQFRRRDLA